MNKVKNDKSKKKKLHKDEIIDGFRIKIFKGLLRFTPKRTQGED